jgi:hypothetical protein
MSFLNDSNAEGSTFFPRTITPSISNNSPKAGFPTWKEACSYLEMYCKLLHSLIKSHDVDDDIPNNLLT